MHPLIKRFFKLVALIIVAWAFCLIIFLIVIPTPKKVPETLPKVDAVIILTGDYFRLEKGVEVFVKSDAKKILLSGVPKKVPKKSVLRRIKQLSKVDLPSDSLYLGHIADSTISNATEAKIFMDLNGYKSLNLVTSNYHIPRSLYLFHRAMPECEIHYTAAGLGKIELIRTKWRYLITEYHKLVGTIAMNVYEDLSNTYYNIIKSSAAYLKAK